jgi:alpha-tubulin suppressor-like RCC1 family protein
VLLAAIAGISLSSCDIWVVHGLAAGGDRTCEVRSNGAVACWGENTSGGLGDGTSGLDQAGWGESDVEVVVSGISNATAVTAGNQHTCALLSSGTIDCWGSNSNGQLGDGTTNDSPSPVAVSGISNATAVTAGNQHTCALLSSGTIDCWGSNSYGQLGNGTNGTPIVDVNSTAQAVKVPRVLGSVSAVALGGGHGCALLQTGVLVCWGSNSNGQLGDGVVSGVAFTPVGVSGVTNATAITAGDEHTCALLSGGSVDCWGSNSNGQLGDGSQGVVNSSWTPVAVLGLSSATAITAGSDHSCALISDGTVDCWGWNNHGQLGDGTTTDSPTPQAVSGIANAIAIAAGGEHTCALISDGTVDCWGWNYRGQLGDGTTIDSPTPVAVSGVTNAVAITGGQGHSCALLSDGTVECWGSNLFDQLGDGGTADSATPVPVSGIGSAIAVSAQESWSTCALLSGGTVECWGEGTSGELGNGALANSPAPVPALNLTDATSVATGSGYACAVRSTGRATCWGASDLGELGDGTQRTPPLPFPGRAVVLLN